jgi:CheY-like chemotaxis protein
MFAAWGRLAAMRKAAPRILVVDDLDDVRSTAGDVLSIAGYDVMAAANSDEALSLLAQHPSLELLFTDIVLGRAMNGFELAQRAVELRPQLKVLYSTGYAWNLEEIHAAVPGSRMLRKPYRAHDLLREVDLLLDGPAPIVAAPDRDARRKKAKPAILVVEDDQRSSAIAVELFMGLGLVVFSAGSAEDALLLLAKHPEIAVLFSDIRLPGMSGAELAEDVRKHRPDIKIVLTSAYMETTPVIGTSFVRKPWSTTDFALVAGMITRH